MHSQGARNQGAQNADERTRALWSEAALAASAEESLDVRWEARGLMVAEMADVRLADRLAALALGTPTQVVSRRGSRLTGEVVAVGIDHVILDGNSTILIPHGAILIPHGAIGLISALPRVLRDDSSQENSAHQKNANEGASLPRVSGRRTWRSVLQEFLGERIALDTSVQHISGCLTWVGHDHISINHDDDSELTVPWWVVESIVLPNTR